MEPLGAGGVTADPESQAARPRGGSAGLGRGCGGTGGGVVCRVEAEGVTWGQSWSEQSEVSSRAEPEVPWCSGPHADMFSDKGAWGVAEPYHGRVPLSPQAPVSTLHFAPRRVSPAAPQPPPAGGAGPGTH